ncbi:hypothetical protein E6O75_ATG03740 [Venturia nashicola]|uniref:Uncharacterized protein n=1 Tax=Venturia nashicola TaxID=86259 RepID=A0A4Z1P9D8_9PEZI|nr:hypothetical protein E6O75_ATG03740 [Venturia nashicola]
MFAGNDTDTNGFLTLPREIRQQILFFTYDFPHVKELTWITWIEEFGKTSLWIMALRNVHPTVTEDMQYVAKEWRKQLQLLTQELVRRIKAHPQNFEHLLKAWKLEDAEKSSFGIGPGPVHFRKLCIERQQKVTDKFCREMAAGTGGTAKSFVRLLQSGEVGRGRHERHRDELQKLGAIWREGVKKIDEEDGIMKARLGEIFTEMRELGYMTGWL